MTERGAFDEPLNAASLDERSGLDEFPSPEFLTRLASLLTESLESRVIAEKATNEALRLFDADHVWFVRLSSPESETAELIAQATRPDLQPLIRTRREVSVAASRSALETALRTGEPVVFSASEIDPALVQKRGVRSQLAQVLGRETETLYAIGIAQLDERAWTAAELAKFAALGTFTSIALRNAERHRAKLVAVLDQLPEAAAIFDRSGRVEVLNAAGQRDPIALFSSEPERPVPRHRTLDGVPLTADQLPVSRATSGELVRADYLVRDPKTGEDRITNLRAAPITDRGDRVVGAVMLARDVTEERAKAEREANRRRRAECLAGVGLDLVNAVSDIGELASVAHRVGQAITGSAMIYLYHTANDQLDLVGWFHATTEGDSFSRFVELHPYRPGEGIPGTVFQIGRPLFFSEVRGDAVVDFARTEEERQLKRDLGEESLIGTPIEAYGERLGTLVISRTDARRRFDAEDLEFAQALADRIGAAVHTHRLTRLAQEGHRAAEELARREVDARARLEGVLDTAPIGIAVVSADELRFEMANPLWVSFASRYGRISEDTKLVGLRVDEVMPGVERELKEVAERGETKVTELRLARGNSVGFFNRIISPVRGRFSGTTQSLTLLVQDVTEQTRAKKEIEALAQLMEERSARLDSILGSMTDGLWVYDSRGDVVDVNQAAVAMFGLASRSEAVAHGSLRSFDLRFPDGKQVPADEMPYARALRGEVVPDYLAMGRHLITRRDLDLSIAAAPIESGGVVVGAVLVMRDITGLQELDRKKDEFLSVASHELRTPLTTIKGYAQLLEQTVNDLDAQERQTYLNAVLGEIERMMGLISELLDVSRIETNRLQIQPRRVEWVSFLERQTAAFRVQNPRREINFKADAGEISVNVDPDRMRQVVDNLLSNALKYSPEGSPIDVSVRHVDGSLETTIADYGIGIPKDELPQLFERFHRARNVSSRYYGGLGLGLYIANAIVEAHGGEILVESEEGKGSTFTVRMPVG